MSVDILKQKFKDDQSKRMLANSRNPSAKRRRRLWSRQVLTLLPRGVDGERVFCCRTRHLINEVVKIVNETFPKDHPAQIQHRPKTSGTVVGGRNPLHHVMSTLDGERPAMRCRRGAS